MSGGSESGFEWELASAADLRPGQSPLERQGGQQVGDYELLEELARGGMAAVHRARHTRLGRQVAIKTLLAGRQANPQQRRRFQLEAQATAQLRHPHIVAIHQVGEQAGCPFLVMDLIEGRSLQERVERQGPLDPRAAAELTRKLAEALDYAHQHLILHRDVKPDNVLLTAQGEPLLTDFGLAKILDAGPGPTRSGQLLGTPHYMAPEQAGGGLVDARADVYGLGALLYALLVGEPPFQGEESLLALLARVASEEPAPPSHRRAGIDADLETICLKCLEKEPARRYASATELAADLARYGRQQPILARAPSGRERLAKWARRNPAVARLGVGALTLVVVLAAAALLWNRQARARALASRVAAARSAAEETWQRFCAAPAGDQDRRAGLALEALRTAQRWRELEPRGQAADAQYRAGLGLGDVALASEEWVLARQGYRQAAGLGVDDPTAQARLARVDAVRDAEAQRRRREIEGLLQQAEAGELARRPDGLLDAVFAIVRYPEAQTVQLLAGRLEALAHELRVIQREVYLAAEQPTREEAAWGEGPLVGLTAALDALEQTPLGVSLSEEHLVTLDRAMWRLERRDSRRKTSDRLPILRMVGVRQRSELGQGRLDAAKVACQALGRIGVASERAVEALAGYLQFEGDELRAIPAAVALVRLGTNQALVYAHGGRARHGYAGTLSTRLEQALEREGTRLELDETAGSLLHRSAVREAQGDLAGARADLDLLLEREPESTSALNNRGVVRQRQGDLEGARRDFDRAVELLGPRAIGVLLNRARLRRACGDVQGALDDCNRSLNLAPNNPRALEERADELLALSRPDLALADLARALEIDPSQVSALLARGEIYRAQGRTREAMADVQLALLRDPANAVAFNNRGLVRHAEGDLEGALADYDRALRLQPDLFTALNNRAYARRLLGDLEGARRDFERAVEIDPSLGHAWGNLGLIKRAQGDVAGAIADLERCLEVEPDHPQAETLLGILDELRAR